MNQQQNSQGTEGPLLNLVIIGSSTGGTRILPVIFSKLSVLKACIIVVQHMPQFINESFARSLDQCGPMPARLARHSEKLSNGQVFVVPGEIHCSIVQNSSIRLWKGERVNFVCPSVDVTMQSLCQPRAGEGLMGIILTGMGKDGAAGIIHIKKLGGTTVAQDKASSAIHGMPAEAIKTGCVDYVLSPADISTLLNQTFG